MVLSNTSRGLGALASLGAGYLLAHMISTSAISDDDFVVKTHELLERFNLARQEQTIAPPQQPANETVIVVAQETAAPVIEGPQPDGQNAVTNFSYVERPYIVFGGETSVPIGHSDYCKRLPGECDGQTTNPQTMTLTDDSWAQLVTINNYYNALIKPMTDDDKFRMGEFWAQATLYGNEGDCEDYVLDKRAELIRAGWDPSMLLIAVVRQIRDGAGHAVLIARTDRGDLVLDNQEGLIKRWDEINYYDFIKVTSPTDEASWRLVDPNRPLTTASAGGAPTSAPL